MRYILTHRLSQTTDAGAETKLSPIYADVPGDPEEAWKRRVERLREQRLHRDPADLQSIETVDGKHVRFATATRLEYELVPS